MYESEDEEEGFAAGRVEVLSEAQRQKHSPERLEFAPTDLLSRFIRQDRPLFLEHSHLLEAKLPTERLSKYCQPEPLQPFDSLSPKFRLVYKKQQEDGGNGQSHLVDLKQVFQGKARFVRFKPRDSRPETTFGQGLSFDSRFESGNLHSAFRKQNSNEYVLLAQNDTNTNGYNQWFYFMARGLAPKLTYRFRVANLRKGTFLYSLGWAPVYCPEGGKSWLPVDSHHLARSSLCDPSGQPLHQLTFTIELSKPTQFVYVASNPPYSYSRLISFLRPLEPSILCWSLANNAVPYLRLGAGKGLDCILITARQHPSETVSSYLAEEFISELLGSSAQAAYLRERFQLIVIPMTNVDGVIYGNSRCDLVGLDVNRQWVSPYPQLQPQLEAIKQLLRGKRVRLLLDLHGHSKKLNAFAYCCPSHPSHNSRILPALLSELESCFLFKDCTFGITPDKVRTARATLFREFGAQAVTIQCSFFGFQAQPCKYQSWGEQKFRQLARHLIRAVSKMQAQKQESELVLQQVKGRLGPISVEEQDSGSDSQPEVDNLDLRSLLEQWDIKPEKESARTKPKIRVKKQLEPRKELRPKIPFAPRLELAKADKRVKEEKDKPRDKERPKEKAEPPLKKQESKPKRERQEIANTIAKKSLDYDRQRQRIKMREASRNESRHSAFMRSFDSERPVQSRQDQQSPVERAEKIHVKPQTRPKIQIPKELLSNRNLPFLYVFSNTTDLDDRDSDTERGSRLKAKEFELSTAKRSDQRIVNYARFRREAEERRREASERVSGIHELRNFSKIWKENSQRYRQWFDY